VTDITARFGSFLRHNSIMPYCDAVKEYIQFLIYEARQIGDDTGELHFLNKVKRLQVELNKLIVLGY
jgi:hypothetical protein